MYLYDDPSMENLRVGKLADFARRHIPGLTVETRGDIFSHFLSEDEPGTGAQSEGAGSLPGSANQSARSLASAVRSLAEARLPMGPDGPLPMEVKVEERRLREPGKLVRGIMYDGVSVLMLVWGLIPEGEAGPESLHIGFTSRLVGTLDPGGGRHHARVILCAHQALISTVGMVEGPARDREYYLTRSVEATLGATPGSTATRAVEGEGDSPWLEVDDPRLTEVAKGYLLQAVFNNIAASPFCDDPSCRLFDAHTQKDMLAAQQGEPGLCGEHMVILRGL